MNIAFLTPEYPHPKFTNSGGIGTSIMNLAKGLVHNGCTVMVLVYGQKQDDFFEEDGIQFYLIKNIKIKGLSGFFTKKKIQRLINTLIKQGKIDIVEAPDWTGISSFINVNCPMVIREHGSDTYFCHLDQRTIKFLNKFHEKLALKNADGIISVSKFTGELTNTLFGLNLNFTVIPNCIQDSYFERVESQNDKEQIILYFGSLIRKKGLLELPHIFNLVVQQNPNVKLMLVGKDVSDIKTGNRSTWEMMKKIFTIQAFNNVEYIGTVHHQIIKTYIEQSTICVFPSFAEALPLSWLEAMAVGKAVVASNIGWATEIIDEGIDGFLVHPTNHKHYAEKINTLLSNAVLRNSFGIKATEKVHLKFGSNQIVKKNIRFYKTLLKNQK